MSDKATNINNDEAEKLLLIIEMKKGSAEAFKIIYAKYKERVFAYCAMILNDRTLAQDAYQDTFLKVYQNRKNFTGNNLGSWIFVIARNICLNYLRVKKPLEFTDLSQVPDVNIEINTNVLLKDYIDAAVAKLPVIYREAIILREYHDYSYKEISEIVDADISAVKVRVLRARTMLREILEPVMKELNEH